MALKKTQEMLAGALGIAGCFILFGGLFAAWCQHLYTCFNERLWGFLVAGALFFPVAIVHGFGIWFGWWH